MAEDQPIPEVFRRFTPDNTLYVAEPEAKSSNPWDVIRETGAVFDAYFLGHGKIKSPGLFYGYLATHTLNFLHDAMQGNLLANFLKISYSPNALNEVFEYEKGIVISPFAWDAYGIAQHVFENMPRRNESIQTSLLAPPPHPEAFTKRVIEIRGEVLAIINGSTPAGTDVRNRLSLFRTFAFVKTGQELLN